jgi:hypothetical protein
VQVSFADCYREIVERVGSAAKAAYDEWRSDPTKADVVSYVTHFTHSYLFAIEPKEFEEVRQRMASSRREHALEGAEKEDETQDSEGLENSWAYVQLFYRFIEEKRCVPSWLEWRRWLATEVPALLVGPLKTKFDWDSRSPEQRSALRRSLRWRIGNAYYGTMRELNVLIRLRAMGIPVKYHVLADALFAVDCWNNDNIVSVFVGNATMKDAKGGGRKRRPQDRLGNAKPPFAFHDITLRIARGEGNRYGILYLADDQSIRRVAEALKG